MSEHAARPGSRWRNFLIMLPFFLIGIAVPVYYYGFSGDGGSQVAVQDYSQPAPTAVPSDGTAGTYPGERRRGFGIVGFARRLFEDPVAAFSAPSRSPLVIKLGVLAVIFVVGFLVLRLLLSVATGALGSAFGFLVHKAAGPMFMGFLAVGSTWGIHQTVAEQFGMTWAAATVAITAAIATLFAFAGVQVRG